jgi:hypothetical protein
MFRSITAQSIAAIVVAAGVAGLVVFVTSGTPEASAAPLVKSEPVPVATGAACSSRGWPAYEKTCQFDLRRPANEARIVRIVGLR